MHIQTGLLTVGVSAALYALSTGGAGFAVRSALSDSKGKSRLSTGLLTGKSRYGFGSFAAVAAVFAAQTLNFPLMGGASSGHILGGAI
ncbi:MAG: energy-coupling factor ABC transporter permease, partial [Oscillospiraceae bacterium]|nr:energy-coupling factor ABC transporter permease [Oscillospiraceae bacterium]